MLGWEIKRKPRAKYEVRKLNRLILGDDDILVIHADRRLTKDSADALEATVKRLFGENREVLIFDKGVEMTVIAQSQDADADSS